MSSRSADCLDSAIREAVELRQPVMVQDPRLMGPNMTEALRGRPVSVLCAPVCDPRTREPLAMLYVQNEGVRNAFGEIDRRLIARRPAGQSSVGATFSPELMSAAADRLGALAQVVCSRPSWRRWP